MKCVCNLIWLCTFKSVGGGGWELKSPWSFPKIECANSAHFWALSSLSPNPPPHTTITTTNPQPQGWGFVQAFIQPLTITGKVLAVIVRRFLAKLLENPITLQNFCYRMIGALHCKKYGFTICSYRIFKITGNAELELRVNSIQYNIHVWL